VTRCEIEDLVAIWLWLVQRTRLGISGVDIAVAKIVGAKHIKLSWVCEFDVDKEINVINDPIEIQVKENMRGY
jgi:hypothetical protein